MHRKNTSIKIAIILTILGITILSGILSPISNASGLNQNAIDEYAQKQLKQGIIPGMTIGIIENNSIYVKGYGKAAKNVVMTEETPIPIGGISKSITAIAIMQLNESGLLDLDENIPTYIPWFIMKSPQAQNITIRELLSHTSGISYSVDTSILNQKSSLTSAVRSLAGDELIATPGTEIIYSDVNYEILGLLIEFISNQSYSEYIQNNIFSPLGMIHSYADFTQAMENGASHGFNIAFGFPIESKNDVISNYLIPSNGLCISVEDMTILVNTLMNNGNYSTTEQLLKPLSIQEMFSIPSGKENVTSFTLGWSNSTNLDNNIIASLGNLKDFHAEIIMIPERNISVIIFINTNSLFGNKGYYSNLGENLLNLVLGNTVKSKFFGYNILYLIIDLLIFITITREGYRYIFIKKQFGKSVKGIIDPIERRHILISKIIVEFIMGLLIILIIPLLIGLGLGIRGLSIFSMIDLQPDISWWLIFFALSYTIQGILKFVLYKKKIVK